MVGLSRPDWQGTKRIKNPPHHASKSQVWKLRASLLLSCSDNTLDKKHIFWDTQWGNLLPSKAPDLLVSPVQKIQWSITQALQEHREHYGAAPADKSTCWYHVIKMESYKPTRFVSPSSSCRLAAGDIHSYGTRRPETFSKYTRKLLNQLQTDSQAAAVYKT